MMTKDDRERPIMRSLQDQILDLLQKNKNMHADELVRQILAENPEQRESQVRAAFFPLMSTQQIELAQSGNVKLLRELACN